MFEGEFIAALQAARLPDVRRSTLKGSYAGATGYPQFMPSVVLRLRADGDGDGYADIWRSEDDAFASIAKYLRDAGWKPNMPWGVPVPVPATSIAPRSGPGRAARAARRFTIATASWLTVREWRAMGVYRPKPGSPTMRWRR